MAKKDIKSTKIQYPVSITGSEIIFTDLRVAVSFAYKERTHFEGGIFSDSDTISDAEYFTAEGEEFDAKVSGNDILQKALELAKNKATQKFQGIIGAIAEAKTKAGG